MYDNIYILNHQTHSQYHVKSQFGVELQQLFPRNEAKIPFVLEKCFECIESHGKKNLHICYQISSFSPLRFVYTGNLSQICWRN